jgi:bacterioferritin
VLNTTFIDDMCSRRAQARKYMVSCSASHGQENPQTLIDLLNEALATELICVLRNKAHYYASHGFPSPDEDVKLADAEYMEYANQDQKHVDQIAERITQLGGHADFNPAILGQRGYSDYTSSGSPLDTLNEDLIAGRIVVDIFNEMIRFIGRRDLITRTLLERIVEQKEEHATQLMARIQALRITPPARVATMRAAS